MFTKEYYLALKQAVISHCS